MKSPKVRIDAGARSDLISILRYGYAEWGARRAERYQVELEQCMDDMASGKAVMRIVNERRRIFSSLCREHIVYARRTESELLVLAVLHQRMDLEARLTDRLT